MNIDLQAIAAATQPGPGRDLEKARALADAYVVAHSDDFAEFRAMSIDDAVRAVEVFRAAGMDEYQWLAETWVHHRFGPQTIGGPLQPTVRIPNAG